MFALTLCFSMFPCFGFDQFQPNSVILVLTDFNRTWSFRVYPRQKLFSLNTLKVKGCFDIVTLMMLFCDYQWNLKIAVRPFIRSQNINDFKRWHPEMGHFFRCFPSNSTATMLPLTFLFTIFTMNFFPFIQ